MRPSRRRRRSALEIELSELWVEDVRSMPCAVCAWDPMQMDLAESLAADQIRVVRGHHILRKSIIIAERRSLGLLTDEALQRVLWDLRNRLPVCDPPGNPAHHSRGKKIPRPPVPAEAFEFADELGLRHRMESDYS